MLRAETVGRPKVVRGGRGPTARPQLSRDAAATAGVAGAAGSEGRRGGSSPVSFLDIPYELRLMIYELILISPDPVVISPSRRHLRYRVATRPAANGNTYLRARRPRPEKFLVRQDEKLHAGILGACRQTNYEATRILYGKNRFIVGQLLPLKIGGLEAAIEAGYGAPYFFLWHLRQTTLALITSITFCKACYCTTWLLLDNSEFETDGATLRRVAFRGHRPGCLLPSPSRARETFRFINKNIMSKRTIPPVFMVCPHCFREHGIY